MPKHKSAERVESSDDTSDSGPDPDPEPVQKKQKLPKKPEKKSSDEQDHMYAISRQRFINVREFRGKILIDIREYYESGGDLKPGKKGISLTVEQWRKLEGKIEEVNESISALA